MPTERSALTVFLHTNLSVANGTPLANARTITGWAGSSLHAAAIEAMRARLLHQTRVPLNLDQSFKYKWLVDAAQQQQRAVEPWMLTDTDVIVQCDASEVARRFAEFGVPLVVAAERWLFPQPMPYGSLSRELIVRTFGRYPATRMRYPNSGVLIGSSAGFEMLWRKLQSLPGFPCCRWWPAASGQCIVDDQGCLQAALQQLRRGVDYELDRAATLFLSMYMVKHFEFNVSSDGRVRFLASASRSGTHQASGSGGSNRSRSDDPCILHFNGIKGHQRLALAARASGATWVPRVSASLRGRGAAGASA